MVDDVVKLLTRLLQSGWNPDKAVSDQSLGTQNHRDLGELEALTPGRIITPGEKRSGKG